MTDLATNLLHYGDNLDILRRDLPDADVDLIYLDPPSTRTATKTPSSATSRARDPRDMRAILARLTTGL